MKRYECNFMIKSISLDAKNKKQARFRAIKSIKEDLRKNWIFDIKEIKSKSHKKFKFADGANDYIITGFVMLATGLFAMVYVMAYGIPNFSNIDEQRIFCHEQGGMPMEPSRESYNEMTCIFIDGDSWFEYVAQKITNEEWAEHMEREVGDYCFSCWDRRSCASFHNNVLREKGVHC